jgi:hypothetical protein
MNGSAGAYYYREYLLVHIITVTVPAGAYYYCEMYLLVHIITVKCTCWCILLP